MGEWMRGRFTSHCVCMHAPHGSPRPPHRPPCIAACASTRHCRYIHGHKAHLPASSGASVSGTPGVCESVGAISCHSLATQTAVIVAHGRAGASAPHAPLQVVSDARPCAPELRARAMRGDGDTGCMRRDGGPTATRANALTCRLNGIGAPMKRDTTCAPYVCVLNAELCSLRYSISTLAHRARHTTSPLVDHTLGRHTHSVVTCAKRNAYVNAGVILRGSAIVAIMKCP